MKISKKMSIGEFAAFVASHLQSKGISTVLTGGAVVSIYTDNKYIPIALENAIFAFSRPCLLSRSFTGEDG